MNPSDATNAINAVSLLARLALAINDAVQGGGDPAEVRRRARAVLDAAADIDADVDAMPDTRGGQAPVG